MQLIQLRLYFETESQNLWSKLKLQNPIYNAKTIIQYEPGGTVCLYR